MITKYNNQSGINKGSTGRDTFQLLQLIWVKATFSLKSEVDRNYLSYIWWGLEPLLHMTVYYIVFGVFLLRGDENFAVFLLTGLIPWMWLSKAIISSSNSIVTGQNIILQIGVSPIVFPLAILLQCTLKQIPVFLLLFVFVVLQGHIPGTHWWALLPLILTQALVITVVSCAVAAIIPFLRDLNYLVPTGTTFLMFLSGIFYDYRNISEEWQGLFLLNPIAFLLKSYREVFIEGILPDMQILIWWGAGATIACFFIILIYKRLRYVYPRIIME